jgi:CheY-like chemotaxis protein
MLTGQTVLIVEEEFLIALDIQRVLEDRNAGQCVCARSVAEALSLRERWPDYQLAIVEFRADQPDDTELLRGLTAAGIRLIITTADHALHSGIPDAPGMPILVKPFPEADLVSAIALALTQSA